MIGDADRRQWDALVMLVDPVAIIVMRAGKADHLPRHHILVAAIDRIGEEPRLRVGEDQLEEILTIGAIELERAVFQAFDDLVLLIAAKLGKGLVLVFAAAGGIECGECLAIALSGRFRGLRALLFGTLLK